MKNSYPASGVLLLLLLNICFAQPNESASRKDYCLSGRRAAKGNGIVRVSGQLVERASQRPIEGAIVMVICGDRVLANRRSTEHGTFDLYIPPEKISDEFISIRIKYRNQFFVKDQLDAVSQDIFIEINGAVFLENHPIKDYKMPIHVLGDPEVGRVLIRS